jgi:mycofactocin system glycosyltransferase
VIARRAELSTGGGEPAEAARRSLPPGFPVSPDRYTRELGPGLLFGGHPARVLRLSAAGSRAWAELRAGRVVSPQAAVLARKLLDAEILQPRPTEPAGRVDVEVVVPVKDRPELLAQCLDELQLGERVIVVDDGSTDPAAIARVAHARGARVVRRDVNGGPAAARNTGLAATHAAIVALVDSDALIGGVALAAMTAHFADPSVGAVAPRVRARGAQRWTQRYLHARGPLDLGGQEAMVRPGGRVTYVPTATVIARRTALLEVARGGQVFDEALRYGEDVDLVWRLGDCGWRVRYDPRIVVDHIEPDSWRALLARRFAYGTSAGPLARRHGARLAPVVVSPWPAAVVLFLLARRHRLALASMIGYWVSMWLLLRRKSIPRRGVLLAGARGVVDTATGLGRPATQLMWPALVLLAAASPRHRMTISAFALAPVLRSWWPHRRTIGPVRFTAAVLVEEACYGAGVWRGSRAAGTWKALLPAFGRSLRVEQERCRSS